MVVGTETTIRPIEIAANIVARILIVDPEARCSCFIRCCVRARVTLWLRTFLVFARGRRNLMESKHRNDQFDNVRRLRLTRATASSKKIQKRKTCPPSCRDAMISCRDVVLNRVLCMSSLYSYVLVQRFIWGIPRNLFFCVSMMTPIR